MKSLIEWRDDGLNASLEERATVADLRLFVDDQNATLHSVPGGREDHVTIALYGFVDALVHDWWWVFGARDQKKGVSLRQYRSGYLLPDLRLDFDGFVFDVSSPFFKYQDEAVSFWNAGREVLPRRAVESALDALVESVLKRLDSKGFSKTGAHMRWSRVLASRADRSESVFCEAAGAAGFDPYSIPEDAADFIESAERMFDGEALIEFVAGASRKDWPALISWLEMQSVEPESQLLPELRDVAEEVHRESEERFDNSRPERAWEKGYRAARLMRKKLQLSQNERFDGFQALSAKFGAGRGFSLTEGVKEIDAFRHDSESGIHVHLRSRASRVAPLFALARAVGDVACFPEPKAAVINGLRRAYRQAAGRAFAAEFLAPIQEVRSMRDDGYGVADVAQQLHVTSAVVNHQIENASRIAFACDEVYSG